MKIALIVVAYIALCCVFAEINKLGFYQTKAKGGVKSIFWATVYFVLFVPFVFFGLYCIAAYLEGVL